MRLTAYHLKAIGDVAPLREGERLSRAEFERRYTAMPNLKRAELIEGIVRLDQWSDILHAGARAELVGWLGLYKIDTPALKMAVHPTVRLDDTNEPQPDLCVLLPTAMSASRIDDDDFVAGPPDLIGEVVPDANACALHAKFHVYERCGVQEYVVWRTRDEAIDWFALSEGRYVRLPADSDGVLRCRVLPGLWLDPAALVREDFGRLTEVAKRGIATPEHANFVERLKLAGHA